MSAAKWRPGSSDPGDPPHLYSDLAPWWPLLSPPSHYGEEADDLLPSMHEAVGGKTGATLLELGSGGGSLAWHLAQHFTLTIV